jgi:hypothetical protein
MAQPLVATSRITIPYTVDGQPHKARAYCSQSGVVVGGFIQIDSRITPSAIGWNDATMQWQSRLQQILPNTTVFGAALLEERSGVVWNPLDVLALTGTGTNSTKPASQITTVLRDAAFFKVKAVLLDTNQQPTNHYGSPVTGVTDLDTYLVGYSASIIPEDPFYWQKSRGDRFLISSPFVGLTTDFNDRVRRARGLT